MLVQPPPSRVKITDGGVRLTIEIPTKRNWFVILFLGFWLCGWAVGELMLPTKLLTGSAPRAATTFMLAWLGAWTLGGAAAITIFLWMLAGRETISVTQDALSVRRHVYALGLTRTYALQHLSRLRLETHAYNMFDPQMMFAFYGIGGGRVAFDYGSSTVRFGNRIEEPDALRILEACRKIVPKALFAAS